MILNRKKETKKNVSATSNGMKYLIPFAVLSIVFIFGYLEPLSVSPNKSDSLNEIVREMTGCEQQSMWWKCLETLAKKLHRTYSLRDIFAAIATVEDERVIFNPCHELGHLLGRENTSMPKVFQKL